MHSSVRVAGLPTPESVHTENERDRRVLCLEAIEHTYTTFYKTITYHNDLSFSSFPISCHSVCVDTENERDLKVLCLKNKNKTIKYVEQNKI